MPGVVMATKEQTSKVKETKNQRRRRLLKEKKQNGLDTPTAGDKRNSRKPQDEDTASGEDPIEVEELPVDEDDDPLFAQFKSIIEKFKEPDKQDPNAKISKPEVYYDDDDDIPEEDEKPQMSRRKRRQLTKLSVAELRAIVKKPELVEWTDADATEPRLLLAIRSCRNVVPIPDHWSLKREYLATKRGVEKMPFALPKFIADTGIAQMRDAVLERQEGATLKQKTRERVQPKMGRMDIDYQKLYDAFFRFQTKPEMSRYGEIYYEGKEFEANLRHLRPGELSDDLKHALNIPPGAPPPWLINQQRYGPPPAYPHIRIPGLNAPPPAGGQWGFHPGGYGKPPVDEYNRPLYGGDIFGVMQHQHNTHSGEPIERNLWGELQPQEESEEEEEEEAEEEAAEEEEEADMTGTQTGIQTTTGTESVAPSIAGGTESVQGDFTLRKQRREEPEESGPARAAGTVIKEQSTRSSGFFGSEKVYDLKGAQESNLPVLGSETNERKRKAGDVDVSVDVDALERDDKLSKSEVKKQYDAQRQAQQPGWGGSVLNQEDLSDMIADEHRKRQKKDEDKRKRR